MFPPPENVQQEITRACSGISFEQGCVWHMDRNWAQPVIRECAQFPNGEYDDWVDTVTQAIIGYARPSTSSSKTKTTIHPPKPKKRRGLSMDSQCDCAVQVRRPTVY
jgi:hypothetical protein